MGRGAAQRRPEFCDAGSGCYFQAVVVHSRLHLGLYALVVLAAWGRSVGATSTAPPFPEGTRSLEVREQSHVLASPDRKSRHLGKITRGTRVAWKRVLQTDATSTVVASADAHGHGRPCPLWVEIEPQGFLCSDVLEPSTREPGGAHLPILPRGKVAPDDYFHVSANETRVYGTEDDVRAGVVKEVLSTKVMVVGERAVNVDGTPFMKTDHGLIEAAALGRYWPSGFSGIDLKQDIGAPWPLAWVYAVRGGRAPDIVDAPSKSAQVIRPAVRREVVPVLEERDGFVRIGNSQWIERRHLRVARTASPPPGAHGNDQWIDVDLDEQVLVAYEGKRAVFATLVSTGKKGHSTPPGTYRVRAKAATTLMAGDPKIPDRYQVSEVPWAVRFRSGLFIHGVYWHDGFGAVLSHGCVNVSPRDATFLYEWVAPTVPDGWSEVEVPAGEGVTVRLRDHETPDPPAFDYRAEEARN